MSLSGDALICTSKLLNSILIFSLFVLEYTYVHSKECQVQDWKQHKSVCRIIKKRYDLVKEDRSNALPDSSVHHETIREGPCAICLEEMIENPVVLPCGHEFCFECIGEYQCSPKSDNPDSCPYCRGEIPNVVEKSLERNQMYSRRAMHSPKGSEERKKYAKLALAEYENSEKVLNLETEAKEEFLVQSLFMKSNLAAMSDQPEKTIKFTNKTLSLNDKYPGYLDFDQMMAVRSDQAEAYSKLGGWKEAEKMYAVVFAEHMRRKEIPNGNILAGMIRALYMRKEYDRAIDIGNMPRNRNTPGIHKYLALSHKALGSIDEAKKIMHRAILYEEHWDKDNLEENKQLLRELNNH